VETWVLLTDGKSADGGAFDYYFGGTLGAAPLGVRHLRCIETPPPPGTETTPSRLRPHSVPTPSRLRPDSVPMWLLPAFSVVARLAARVYYRVRFAGTPVPPDGPVLLVANHPNSLLDPTLVVAAADRPVRFMAKAPLFSDRKIGWLVRAAGAIPVYRRADDPTQMARNEDAFRAVFEAIRDRSAVGIFPEGISHSEPAMTPLKTGAARIALGAATRIGRAFPIVPVGLTFRDKGTFRSEALVIRGAPILWDDLALRGAEDSEAVRELTARIDGSLRGITLNLSSWEDRPLVETAVRIWESERGQPSREADRLARLEFTTKVLAEVRAQGDSAGASLIADVQRHDRRLSRLGLRPADLYADVGVARGVKWAARRIHLLLPLGVILAAVGAALFWAPYQLTGFIVKRMRLLPDVRSTWKLWLAGRVADMCTGAAGGGGRTGGA
jgi:glycerol-3-phosphate O-acyltransferase/dihydroxyacetone phosphate acyltransferase